MAPTMTPTDPEPLSALVFTPDQQAVDAKRFRTTDCMESVAEVMK